MAIAFDTATDGDFTSGTSHTFSHTCTGSDRLLVVTPVINTSSDLVSGVTYNSVSMTQIATVSPDANRRLYMYYLLNPASGSNTVALSASSSTALGGNASSYTGVKQSAQPDASATNTITSGTSFATTVTTVADNCWSVLVTCSADSVEPTASTNSTDRIANTTYPDCSIFDSNSAITPAGNFTMTVTVSDTNDDSSIIASFAPAAQPAQVRSPGINSTGSFIMM